MVRKSRTFRWLLTAVLTCGTSVAGLLPQIAESAIPAVGPPSSQPAANTCCCGTRSGSCCGMGCCSAKEMPTPDHNRAPVHEAGSNARISPLVLLWSQVCLPAELLSRRAWDHTGEAVFRSRADTTLQAKHVRLDA